MRFAGVSAAIVVALALAGCGGGGSSSSSGGSGSAQKSSSLVASVSDAQGKIENGKIVATASVKIGGGPPGKSYTLHWGVIDAVSGVRASDSEPVIARYKTTPQVESHDIHVTSKVPGGTTAYIVHFSLDGPDGSYVDGSDSKVFQVPGA